ncbi:MAG: ABC transporter permease, partial [Mesorhizobium sp.]
DISVGPLMGFVNALVIQLLFLNLGMSSPWIIVPAALLVGAVVGAANGVLATIVRIQPIVATLGTYLILTGVTLTILPAPIGPAPDWLKAMAGPLSIVPLALIGLCWFLVRRTPYYDLLM